MAPLVAAALKHFIVKLIKRRLEKRAMKKLLEILAARRTSTKAGLAGLVPLVTLLPFYGQVNDYLLKACMSEEGPAVFLIGGAVVWVTMIVAARVSKTPENPGAL